MATVTEYQRRIADRPINQQSVTAPGSGTAFGAGIAPALNQLNRGIGQLHEATVARERLKDDGAARDAFNKYRSAQNKALLDPESGYLNTVGKDGVGIEETAGEALDQLGLDFAEGLSPQAKQLYDERVGNLRAQADERLLNHSSNQTKAFILGKRQSTVQAYAEEAVTNWSHPQLFAENLARAREEQREVGILQGWDDDTIGRADATLVSTATKQRVLAAAVADPRAAASLLSASRDDLSAADEYALDVALKGPVREANVDAVLAPFVGRGGGGSGDPYLDAVTRAESGNNPDAAHNPDNPGAASADGTKSSSLGAHGFLRGTYLGTVRELQRAGGARWAEGLSDDEIAGTRTDRKKEMEVFKHFRKGNAAQLAALGHEVTPVNEYAMHHFGDGGGTALIRMAKIDPGAPLRHVFGRDTDAITKANPQFKNMTAGEAYDWLENHLRAEPAATASVEVFDAAGAMKAAMAITDPETRASAVSRVNTMMLAQDRTSTMARTDAQKEAWDRYLKSGNDTLTLAQEQAMGQSGLAAFRTSVRNDKLGTQITDADTWEDLTRMAASDPTGFAELNLTAHYSRLSREDRRHFVALQENVNADLRGDVNKEAAARNAIDYEKAYSSADDVYRALVDPSGGADLTEDKRQRRLRFQQQLTPLVNEFWARNKREPNASEVRDMAATLAMPVRFFKPGASFFSGGPDGIDERGDGSLFDAATREDGVQFEITVAYEDVPVSDRAATTAKLMQVNGGEIPDQQQVADFYETRRLLAVGITPDVDIDAVPSWLIDVERGENPGITDGELVMLYLGFISN